ncbi:MAG: hypothetical protein M3229_04600, partial [Actinomycetota bacterium]|nr:hypothetical protein [Actinomycetota bacterium]
MAAALLVAAAIAAGFLSARGKVEERRAELETLKVQLAATPRRKQPRVQVSPQLAAEKDARFA